MRFGGRVLEVSGLWCSVSERGGPVWKSSVSDRERAREEVRAGEHVGVVVVYFSGYLGQDVLWWICSFRTQLLVDQNSY